MRISYLVNIVKYMLDTRSIYASRKEIFKILTSDPEYPSLESISAILSYYGITSNAYITDFNHIKELNNPIIHSNENGGHFYILKEQRDNLVYLYDGKNIKLTLKQFEDLWDGIILVTDNNIMVTNTCFPPLLKIFIIVSLIIIYVYSLYISSYKSLLLLDGIGLTLSYLLLNKQLFSFANMPFCIQGKKVDCEYVFQKSPFKKWLPVNLPILGICFFLFDYLYLIFFGWDSLSLLPFYLCGSIFMASMIIYQLFVIKKYCLYCIGVSVAVFIKAVIGIINFNTFINLFHIFISALISFSICSLIFLYKTIEKRNFDNEISLLKIKRNKKVINTLFNNKQQILSPCNNVLSYGNPEANIKITTFINLDCEYCKKTTQDMILLLKKFPKRFCWNLIIDGYISSELSDKEFEHINCRQLYIYSSYKTENKKNLPRLNMNIPKKWSCPISLMQQYKVLLESVKKLNIIHYPVILINNKVLPKEYEIKDLQYLSTHAVYNIEN